MSGVGAPLAIGVAGVGSLGFHHARILGSLEHVTRAGFFDPDAERSRHVAAQLTARSFESLDALLDECDALIVATPTVEHEAVALAALDRGLPVFIEKPIAPSLSAADRILDAARESGAIVQVGHVERFNAAILAAKRYLESPLFIESHRLAPFVPRSLDIAVVLDLMIHDVDLVRALVGRPVESIAATGVPVITSTVDIANARLTFEGGVVANLTASRVALERKRRLRIFQRSGYVGLDLAAGTGEFLRLRRELPALSPDGGSADLARLVDSPSGALSALVERIPIVGDGVEPLRRQLESFRDAIISESAPVVSGTDGRDAIAVALSIEELIQSHVADTRSA